MVLTMHSICALRLCYCALGREFESVYYAEDFGGTGWGDPSACVFDSAEVPD